MFRLLALLAVAVAVQGASITKTGHRPNSLTLEVGGVGSGAFDPARFSSWCQHHEIDSRSPLVHAKPGGHCPDTAGNIYNANCVNNGEVSVPLLATTACFRRTRQSVLPPRMHHT